MCWFVGGASVAIGRSWRDAAGEAGRACLIGVLFPGSLLRDQNGQLKGGGVGGPSVQPGQLFHYRELTRTIHR